MKATLVNHMPKQPGEYRIYYKDDQPARLYFCCPCGCNSIGGITLKPAEPSGWDFNGDINTPTTKPSILLKPCGWHGYLTNGHFHT